MKSIKNTDSFGKRLRNARLHIGLSQNDLAEQLNTSNKMISRYERDEVKPSIEVALKLAKILNTSVGFLLGEVKFPEDPELESILRGILNIPENEQTKIKNTLVSLLKVTHAELISK
ncbi:MAG TPA: helix-turn-helix transcriptional regulator [Cyclobacteriaceae bacterium]|nr:helix-turn-helix transcriptional regulator [Cyclobacteriaceae bacterium]